jgi:hypothetical protein
VGVLDSLFPPKLGLLEKMQIFENCLEINNYYKKLKKATEEGKTIKQTHPYQGEIPEFYLNIENDPMRNAAVKKSILPSLLVGLYDLGQYHSKCIIGKNKPSKLMTSPSNKQSLLVTGSVLQRLDEMKADEFDEDKFVAVTTYVVETSTFDYKNNTKQALKIVMDCDGYVQEHVLWPNYYTNALEYPKDLKKGNICTIFLKKRTGKDDPCTIQEIVIEA